MNKFNIQQFLEDYNVPFIPDGNILQVHCPFCLAPGSRPKLGIFADYGNGNCWKCNKKSRKEIIEAFADGAALKTIYDTYGGEEYTGTFTSATKIRGGASTIELPGEAGLNEAATKYITGRGFDPVVLSTVFQLYSTDHLGKYNFRVVIPILWKKKIVSYTCRDYTGKRPKEKRYLTCDPDKEILFHKSILYNYDNCNSDSVILVEGPIDTWPFRTNACAPFSSTITDEQLLLLLKFKRVYIMFDPEPDAQAKAKKAAEKLTSLGVYAEVVDIGSGDPGAFSDEDAAYVKRELEVF